MRIKVEFRSSSRSLLVPANHNYMLQAYIYSAISDVMAKRLHNEGWQYGKRRFKMFTFSRLQAHTVERLDSSKTHPGVPPGVYFRLSSPVWFVLSSPEEVILQELSRNLLDDRDVRLGSNLVKIQTVSVLPDPDLPAGRLLTCDVRTISPITVYKTDETGHTTYFSPHDAAFAAYVRENARRKYTAYFGKHPDMVGFDIVPLDSRNSLAVVGFKDTRIRGYEGLFRLTGRSDVLQLLIEAGVGSKNSEGCGLVSVERWGEATSNDTKGGD